MIIKTVKDALSYVNECAEELHWVAEDLYEGKLNHDTVQDVLEQE